MRVDPWQFAEQLASDLDSPLQRALGNKAEVAKVMTVVRRVLRDRLRKMPDAASQVSADKPSSAPHGSGPLHHALPVDELKPKEVLSANLVDMSLPSLYRATEQGVFTASNRVAKAMAAFIRLGSLPDKCRPCCRRC
jgi:hypothetical protein